jgi:hypothetical protein
MLTQVETVEKTPLVHLAPATTLAEVAETIREAALERARLKLRAWHQGLDLEALLQRPDFLEYFRHELAVAVAKALSAHDPRLQTLYLFDPDVNVDSEAGVPGPVDPAVHLLAVVTAPSAALDNFILALDRALAASLRELPAPRFAQRETLVDVIVLTEREAEQKKGAGALLASVFAPPIKLWDRDA